MSTLRDLLISKTGYDEQIMEAFGEISPEMEAQLIEFEIKLPEKVDRCAGFLARLEIEASTFEAKAKAIQEEADRYKRTANQIIRFVENFEDYIRQQMIANELTELEGIHEKFKLQKTGKLKIEPGTKIPEKYNITEVITKVDTAKLKADVQNGESIPGVSITPTIKRSVNRRK